MAGNDWKMASVSQICDIHIGGTPRREEPSYWGGSIKWASAKDVASCGSRYLQGTEETITQKGLKESAAKLLGKDTIVITARGTVGAMCMLPEPMSFNQTCYGLIAKPQVDPEYLYYALNATLKRILTLTYGTVFETITIKSFDKIEVPLPALKIQRAIAHILGSLDDKIELNRKTNETLEAMARAIFKSWFIDFEPVRAKAEGRDPGLPKEIADLFPNSFEDSELGEIPRGWRVKALPEIIDINPLRSLRKGEEAPYVDMKNMPTQGHRPSAWILRPFGSGMKFMNGDTLLARITPCLENGKTAFVDFLSEGQVGWGSTEYIVFRPKPPLPEYYGYLLARDERLRDFAIGNMTGSSGRQRVPANCFSNFLITAPPKEIAVTFGKLVSGLQTAIKVKDEESTTLAAIRDALLPKLISGEIRVPDSEKVLEEVI